MTTRPDHRLPALRRFALAITVLNVLGHTWFGFEQSWAHPLISLATAYTVELLLEAIDARVNRRALRFAGGPRNLVDFLLPTHITGLATAMLLYSGERLAPIALASTVAIASKYVLRTQIAGRLRHVANPSNFGITVVLLLFPWVGIAPPYMFTENLHGVGDWLLPLILVCAGTFINARFTHRLPLIAAWLGTFALQAVLRSVVFDLPLVAGFLPMTGLAFLLFTFYMVTDPSTTPSSWRGQMLFGASVAATYGALVALHVVYAMFFALSAVCLARGSRLWIAQLGTERRRTTEAGATTPVEVSAVTHS